MKNTYLTALFSTTALLALALSSSCTQPEKATTVLEAAGYTDIVITGYRPWMAGKEDSYSTGFEAKAPNGSKVTGAVTGGMFKGSTIRFD